MSVACTENMAAQTDLNLRTRTEKRIYQASLSQVPTLLKRAKPVHFVSCLELTIVLHGSFLLFPLFALPFLMVLLVAATVRAAGGRA